MNTSPLDAASPLTALASPSSKRAAARTTRATGRNPRDAGEIFPPDPVRAHEATARRAFLPPLILLASLTLLLLALVGNLLSVMRSVDHSDQIIAQTEATLNLVIDSESGERDFLVTADSRSLAAYRRANEQAPLAFGRLALLVHDDPPLGAQVAAIHDGFLRWDAANRGMVGQAKNSAVRHSAPALAMGQAGIASVRSLFSGFLTTEHALRQRRSGETLRAAVAALAGGTLAALLAGSILTAATRRRMRLLSDEYAAVLRHEREAAAEAVRRQRTLVKDVLFALTDGRLRLCGGANELPQPLPPVSGEVPLTHPTLRDFREAVRSAIRDAGIAEERGHDLEMAAGEAAINAVVHAGSGVGRVHADAVRGTVQVWVTDTGPGIQEDAIHRATLERGYSSAGTLGHGFWMMLSTCDRVYLSTGASGTRVVLEQDAAEPAPAWMAEPHRPGSKFVLI